MNRQYSAARQLPVLQLITWNDYEEGTELETGIENCVTVSAGLPGSKLWWNVTGDENTLHHYSVFISSDGELLAQLGDFAPGSASIELSAFNIPAGTYSLFVKAVGKPSLRNQMSAPVVVTLAGGSFQPGGKNVTITATPSSVQVALGQGDNSR